VSGQNQYFDSGIVSIGKTTPFTYTNLALDVRGAVNISNNLYTNTTSRGVTTTAITDSGYTTSTNIYTLDYSNASIFVLTATTATDYSCNIINIPLLDVSNISYNIKLINNVSPSTVCKNIQLNSSDISYNLYNTANPASLSTSIVTVQDVSIYYIDGSNTFALSDIDTYTQTI